MNRLELFRFGDVRKKRYRAMALVVALVLFAALVLLAAVGIFSYKSALVTLGATDKDAGNRYGGIGVNLDAVPNVNLISNASFEKQSSSDSFVVEACEKNALFFEPDAFENAGFDSDSVAGDEVRVMSIDSSGIMSESYSGVVTGYSPARIGAESLIEDSPGLWSDGSLTDALIFQNSVMALTSDGKLLCDIASDRQSTSFEPEGDEIVGISATDDAVYAVTIGGKFYSSTDGRNFTQITLAGDYPVQDVRPMTASTGDCFAAAYSDGTVFAVSGGVAAHSQIPDNSGISNFGCCSSGFLASTASGKLYYSSNGLVFEDVSDAFATSAIVSDITGYGNEFCVLYDDGTIYAVEYEPDIEITVLHCCSDDGICPLSAEADGEGRIIATDSGGSSYCIDEAKDEITPFSSDDTHIDRIFRIKDGQLIYQNSGKLYSASILSELSVQGDIESDSVIEGDMCIVTGQVPSVEAATDTGYDGWIASEYGNWDISGADTDVTSVENSDGSGSCARLAGNGDGDHVLSQKLTGTSADNFSTDTFYRLDLSAMSYSSGGSLTAWIQGDTFGTEGFTMDNIGSSFQEYSFVFAVTDIMTGDDSVRLCISFNGTGTYLIDDIYLGPDVCAGAGIPDTYTEKLASGAPATVRLNNLSMGDSGFSKTGFYSVSEDSVCPGCLSSDKTESCCTSLEDSLRLVSKCNSQPWFVIGPYMSQSDVDDFLEYLCGSVSSGYGGRRIDNGTALPWCRQFDRITIEINDDDNCFDSDTAKAAYVDCVIAMFEQSGYYSDIRDKVTFIDGMKYEGKTMISGADNHSISFDLQSGESAGDFVRSLDSSLENLRYDVPHIASGAGSGEYLSSISCPDTMNSGEILSMILSSNADFISEYMFDADASFVPSGYTTDAVFANPDFMRNLLSLMKEINDLSLNEELYIEAGEPLDPASSQSSENLAGSLTWSAYTAPKGACMLISNPSEQQQNFLISSSKYHGDIGSVMRYSSDGELLTTRRFAIRSMRYTLQPGEFIIVNISD